jgi:protein SCO1/2
MTGSSGYLYTCRRPDRPFRFDCDKMPHAIRERAMIGKLEFDSACDNEPHRSRAAPRLRWGAMHPAVNETPPRVRPFSTARLPALVTVGLCALAATWAVLHHARAPLPHVAALPLGQIPPFEMTDQRGAPVSDQALRGQALVVDFFFASCTSSCPMLTARMAAVEKAVTDREQKLGRRLPVHLVSITLDPENDTPEVLGQYGARYGAGADRWSFLSGRSADLDRIVVRGFKTMFQRTDPAAGISAIMHGEWLVLVDPGGAIRGYYAASDPERMAALVQDVFVLAGDAS